MRRRLLFPCLLTLAAAVLLCSLSMVTLLSARLASSPNGGRDADGSLPSLSGFWGALSDRKMSQLYVPGVGDAAGEGTLQEHELSGSVIMGTLKNETLRAELGRATWRVLHTVAARFPKSATPEEAKALRHFIHLLARLYPCGQCAREFSAILAKHPPNTGGRREASQWACEVHNIVNERLGKSEFDCNQVAERWKCGCDEEDEEGTSAEPGKYDSENGTVQSLPESSDE